MKIRKLDNKVSVGSQNKVCDSFFYNLPVYLIYASILLVPVFFSRFTKSSFLLPKETLASFLSTGILFSWIIRSRLVNRFEITRSSLDIPFILIVIFSGISAVISTCPYLSILAFIKIILFIVFFKAAQTFINTPDRLFKLCAFLVGGLALTAVMGIFEAFDMRIFLWSESKGRLGIISTYGNPNYVAGTMIAGFPIALIIPLAFSLFRISKNRSLATGQAVQIGSVSIIKRVLSFCPAFLIGLLVFLTQTRGSWLGAAFGCAVLFPLIFFRKNPGPAVKKAGLTAMAGMVTVILVLCLAFNVLPGRDLIYKKASLWLNPETSTAGKLMKSVKLDYRRIFKNKNFRQRALVWHATMDMLKSNPVFGIGIGAFQYNYLVHQGKVMSNPAFVEYSKLTGRANQTHNDYLQLFSETGIAGSVIFFWSLFTFLYLAVKSISSITNNGFQSHSPTNEMIFVLKSGILASILSVLIHALVSFPFHLAATSTLFFIMAGALVGPNLYFKNLSKTGNNANSETNTDIFIQPGSGLTKEFILVVTACWLLMSWVAIKPLVASYFSKNGLEMTVVATRYLNKAASAANEKKKYFKKQASSLLERAVKEYEQALKFDPSNGAIHAALAGVYARMGTENDKSRFWFQRSRSSFDSREMYNDMGNIYINMAQQEGTTDNKIRKKYFRLAAENYRLAIYRDINFGTAYSNLGNVLVRLDEYEKAASAYEKAIDSRGKKTPSSVFYNLALCYRKMDRISDSVEMLEKSYSLKKTKHCARKIAELKRHLKDKSLGKWLEKEGLNKSLLYNSQQNTKAQSASNQQNTKAQNTKNQSRDKNRQIRNDKIENNGKDIDGVNLNNHDKARIYHLKGLELGKAGNLKEAIEWFDKSISFDSDFISSRVDMAVALGKLGRIRESMVHLEKALEINPNHVTALNNLAMADLKLGITAAREKKITNAAVHYVKCRKNLKACLKNDSHNYFTETNKRFLEMVDNRLEKMGLLKDIKEMGEDIFLKKYLLDNK